METVRRSFDAYVRGDVDTLLSLLDPAVEVRSLLTEPERTTCHGHGGGEWLAGFEALGLDPARASGEAV